MRSVENRILFMRRMSFLLLITMMVLWLTLVDLQTSSSTYSLRTLSLLARRPIIYTSKDDENKWYPLWDAAWKSAGFRTKAINIDEEARGHPKYDSVSKTLSNFDKDQHHPLFRYLAMSKTGGGIYVEPNVFPLWPLTYDIKRQLLAESKFTVRCGSMVKPSGCFLSGSKQEWDRIADELLTIYEEQHYSDPSQRKVSMDLALQDMTSFAKGHPLAQHESQVLSTQQSEEFDFSSNVRMSQCHLDKLAVRFNDVEGVKEWMTQWNKQCVHKLVRGDLSFE